MVDFPGIPGYKIVSKLKTGGMATIYLGIQEKLNRKVAIKILEPFLLKTKDADVRFQQEAKTAARLSHSNIIQIHDTGKIDNYHYIVMEYLEESLRDKMNLNPKGKMHPEIALDIIENLMNALDYAHFRGVYHRDIKPENIMFKQDSTPVLVDFGIARVFDSYDELTGTGICMGTADYMSPEQCQYPETVDGRTDIYSLGVVLYEMLTGKKPYKGKSYLEVVLKHIEKPIPPLPQKLKHYQPLIDKMMHKDRKKRISSGPELNHLLDRILTNSLRPVPQPGTPDDSSPTVRTIPTEKLKSTPSPPQTTPEDLTIEESPDKKKPAVFKKAPLKRKLLIGIIPVALVVSALVVIFFINQGKWFKEKQKTVVQKDALKTAQDKEQNFKEKFKLANQYLDNALGIIQELEKTKYAPEVKALEKKIKQVKDSTFNRYMTRAGKYYKQEEYLKASENISLAKQIKSTPELLTLEQNTNKQLALIEKQLQQKEKDDNAYELAISENTIDAYRQYLVDFPAGHYVEKVREKLKELKIAAPKQLKVKLRSQYQMLDQKNVREMIKRYDFFDYILNDTGSFKSDSETKKINDQSLVIDHTTGLMWYDGKPSDKMTFKQAEEWLENLDSQKYGGYEDWRFPTLEEAASLLRKDKNKQGLHMDPIFSGNSTVIWTKDSFNSDGLGVILFHAGITEISAPDKKYQVRPVRSFENETSES
jgi:serine/threonine-protein kinase PpkA